MTNSPRMFLAFACASVRFSRTDDDLRQTLAVAKVDKRQNAKIALLRDPAHQHDLLARHRLRSSPQVCVRSKFPNVSNINKNLPAKYAKGREKKKLTRLKIPTAKFVHNLRRPKSRSMVICDSIVFQLG